MSAFIGISNGVPLVHFTANTHDRTYMESLEPKSDSIFHSSLRFVSTSKIIELSSYTSDTTYYDTTYTYSLTAEANDHIKTGKPWFLLIPSIPTTDANDSSVYTGDYTISGATHPLLGVTDYKIEIGRGYYGNDSALDTIPVKLVLIDTFDFNGLIDMSKGLKISSRGIVLGGVNIMDYNFLDIKKVTSSISVTPRDVEVSNISIGKVWDEFTISDGSTLFGYTNKSEEFNFVFSNILNSIDDLYSVNVASGEVASGGNKVIYEGRLPSYITANYLLAISSASSGLTATWNEVSRGTNIPPTPMGLHYVLPSEINTIEVGEIMLINLHGRSKFNGTYTDHYFHGFIPRSGIYKDSYSSHRTTDGTSTYRQYDSWATLLDGVLHFNSISLEGAIGNQTGSMLVGQRNNDGTVTNVNEFVDISGTILKIKM